MNKLNTYATFIAALNASNRQFVGFGEDGMMLPQAESLCCNMIDDAPDLVQRRAVFEFFENLVVSKF